MIWKNRHFSNKLSFLFNRRQWCAGDPQRCEWVEPIFLRQYPPCHPIWPVLHLHHSHWRVSARNQWFLIRLHRFWLITVEDHRYIPHLGIKMQNWNSSFSCSSAVGMIRQAGQRMTLGPGCRYVSFYNNIVIFVWFLQFDYSLKYNEYKTAYII